MSGHRWPGTGVLLLSLTALACGPKERPRPPARPVASPAPAPPSSATVLPVKKAEGEVIVAAWAEPPRLPPGGGDAQILVRLQRRGGKPYPGVEVRLGAPTGRLFSGGRILVTDAGGSTRDRLTTRETTTVTVNAGGTLYRVTVAVGDGSAE